MKIVEKSNVIITDPCYVSKTSDWDSKKFDYESLSIDPSLGFSEYLWKETGFGDGVWKVSEIKGGIVSGNDLEKFIEDIETAYYDFFKCSNIQNQIRLEELIGKRETIGRYCVDSGTFGVFLFDEVLSYHPDFLVEYGSHCYTIIEDFIGDISVYEDSRKQIHVVGIGNKSFYGNTVSWL